MSNSNNWLYFFIGLFLLNLLLGNGYISLWDEDEAAYAGFAWTMLESGNWIQPEFIWSRIHRKTPLHFWNILLSYKLFGVNEWAVRISSVCSIFLTAMVLLKWGAKVFGKRVAYWSAIVFVTSLVVPITGKIALTDATLLLFQTTAVLALFNYLEHPSWRWTIIFWSSISLGILTKGPLIIILCGGIWLFLLGIHKERKRLIALHPWFYGLFALAPTVVWMYLSYRQDGGELVSFLYDWYVVERVGGSVLGQSGFPGYHLVVILIAFLPWFCFLLSGLINQFRYFLKRENTNLYLSAWLIFGWLFFELMSSKLPSYALAVHPAIALIIGKQIVLFLNNFDLKIKRSLILSWLIGAFLFVVIALLIIFLIPYYFGENAFYPCLFLAIFLIAIAISQGYFLWIKNHLAFARTLGFMGWAFLFFTIVLIVPIVEESPMKSLKKVAATAKDQQIKSETVSDEVRIALVALGSKQTKISLPFYLSQHFKEVREWEYLVALSEFLNKRPVILILNKNGIKYMEDELRKRGKELPEVSIIKWWSTDDKLANHDYYILKNFR